VLESYCREVANGNGCWNSRKKLATALDGLTTAEQNLSVVLKLRATMWRLLTTPYSPEPTLRTFASRAETQENSKAQVTVAVLDATEATQFFGVPLARRGIQPVYLRIVNRSDKLFRLQLVRIDPNYYPPAEAAAANHFSIVKRLSAFGLFGWLLLPLLPLLFLLPLKLITAYRANRRMDEFFRSQGFHLRPIKPGSVSEGFVFTSFDAGTKEVHVSLHSTGDALDSTTGRIDVHGTADTDNEFTFSIPVPGIEADFHRRDFESLVPPESVKDCDVPKLVRSVCEMPAATGNAKGSRSGDPVNLVVVGTFEMLIGAFAARWDETEIITLETCWKTMRSFLLGTHYRYSPVSALYLFGRSQDVALQRARESINERLHLRLWLTPLRFQGKSVWVGQVSRDIGVRFTTKTWNLTTHRVDPDVDEARDYVVEDLLQAGRVDATGYVDGVGACESMAPRRNLTGDPYFTDGKRAVIVLSESRTTPRFVAWS
jgi:LssY-like putative type I secretion system component LssY